MVILRGIKFLPFGNSIYHLCSYEWSGKLDGVISYQDLFFIRNFNHHNNTSITIILTNEHYNYTH